MPVRSYQPKGSRIKALRYDSDTCQEAKKWVAGSRFVAREEDDKLDLQFPTFDGITKVTPGDWIVYSSRDGFSIMSQDDFGKMYELVKSTTRKHED